MVQFFQCWLYPNGETLATWVLAIFALVPLFALRRSIMDAVQAKRDKKRADQFDRLKWLDSRFNSPATLVARSELGKQMTKKNRDPSTILGQPKQDAWMVIYFFVQIAQMWRRDWLALDDIAVAYGDYITILWIEFGGFLGDDNHQNKFKILEDLGEDLANTDAEFEMKCSRSGLSAAHIGFVKENFWAREAALALHNEKI